MIRCETSKGDYMLTSIQVTKESEKFPEIVRLYRAAFPREERVALDLLLERTGRMTLLPAMMAKCCADFIRH